MTHGSLFSGIGGFDLAASWLGWNNLFHCEINPFGRKILNHYWPNAISYEDITKTDFSIWRGKIDVLSGGFPCQPFSTAGKRKGKADDRYLWPEMLRAIDEIKPTWVVGENVAGITSMVQPEVFETILESKADFFGEGAEEIVQEEQQYVVETVCSDLERIGYQVQPIIIPACAVGAPHRRDRIWFVAYSANAGIEDMRRSRENEVYGFVTSADTKKSYKQRDRVCKECSQREAGRRHFENYASNSNSNVGFEGGMHTEGSKKTERYISAFDPFDNWRDDWQDFPTQPPVCGRDDGLPDGLDGITFPKWRNESIKAYGNAIVPQVAHELFKVILK